MKRIILLALLLISQLAVAQQPKDNLSLWYLQPAKDWNEALPVGNGRIGAMVYGATLDETIQLNEESLWAGCPADGNTESAAIMPEIQRRLLEGDVAGAMQMAQANLAGNPMCIRSYQPFGELRLQMSESSPKPNDVSDYCRRLDLSTGIAETKYSWKGVTFTREVFASAPDNVIIIKVSAGKPGALTMQLGYSRQKDAGAYAVSDSEIAIEGQIMDLPKDKCGPAGPHMKFAGRIKAVNKGGKTSASGSSIFVENADEVIFIVAMNTDYSFEKLNFDRTIDPAKISENQIAAIENADYEDIKARHKADHAALFSRVAITLGGEDTSDKPTDERLEAVKAGACDPSLAALYFQYGRYMLMGSSRRPGRLPANLQGIWNQDMEAAWNSDFHTNINIQMNYWPAEVCNLSETVEPFSDWINAVREPGRVTASKTFGAQGWTINHVADPFGHTSISDGVGWGTFPVAAAWLVLHQWEHYNFTCDKEYLAREAYPSMKEAAEFLLSFMIEDAEGHLVTAPSNSPENVYRFKDGEAYNLTYGATMDVEIAMELFGACLKAAKIVGDQSDFSARVKTAAAKLPPLKIGKRYNTIQEWIEDYEEVEPGHRHMSHLFGLHPGTTINPGTPELYAAAKRTLERRRKYNEDPATRQGSYTGWSRAWLINHYARLHEGDEAGANVDALLGKSTQSNLFDTHPPFQIDGNFGGTSGIAEMLLQSHTSEIVLLPAIPASWAEGCVSGLRARGGFTVDIEWADGKLVKAVVTADRDGRYPVRYGSKVKKIKFKAGDPVVVTF